MGTRRVTAPEELLVSTELNVLVLGGYGNFGRLIVRRLASVPGVRVLVAGRNLEKAQAVAEAQGARAVRLDIDEPGLAEAFSRLDVQVVISTVGPFQGQDYRVAEAALAAGSHYIDLADARGFVCGITRLDEVARQRGVLLCAGASSVPGLSAAVVDELLPRFGRLERIEHGISSSEKTPGVSTLAAVLNYCGRPIRCWRDGQWRSVYGWQDLRLQRFRAPMGGRWIGACDVPDLELFPARYPGVREVSFRAGVGLRLTQFGTWALSWLVRAGLVRDAVRLAPLLRRGAVMLEPLGDGLSGMFVRLSGQDPGGLPLTLTWELLAHDNDGPNIPCMAAVALVRKLADGSLVARGAMPCIGLFSTQEYLAELEGMRIETQVREG